MLGHASAARAVAAVLDSPVVVVDSANGSLVASFYLVDEQDMGRLAVCAEPMQRSVFNKLRDDGDVARLPDKAVKLSGASVYRWQRKAE